MAMSVMDGTDTVGLCLNILTGKDGAVLYLTEILTIAAVALHCSIGCVIAFTN